MLENLIEFGPHMSQEQLEKTKVFRAKRIFFADELRAWLGEIPMTWELWERCTTAAFTPQTMDIYNQLTIDYPNHLDSVVEEMTAGLELEDAPPETSKAETQRSIQVLLQEARVLFGDRFMEENGLMELME